MRTDELLRRLDHGETIGDLWDTALEQLAERDEVIRNFAGHSQNVSRLRESWVVTPPKLRDLVASGLRPSDLWRMLLSALAERDRLIRCVVARNSANASRECRYCHARLDHGHRWICALAIGAEMVAP